MKNDHRHLMNVGHPGSAGILPAYRVGSRFSASALFVIIWVGLGLVLIPGVLAEQTRPVVSGTITDENLKLISGVQVKLIGRDQSIHCVAVTKDDGRFILEHQPCKSCCLEVSPSKDSRLASAWIDNISGEESRRIVIELHHGFEIHGRVVHGNKGLKGLSVAVRPINEKSVAGKFVHGGGWAQTDRDGHFEMILTAGLKRLTIANERYHQLAKSLTDKLSVTADGMIPDLELPTNDQGYGEDRQ